MNRLANPFLKSAIGLTVLVIALIASMQLLYAGRAMPGVYIGPWSAAGRSRSDLMELISRQTAPLKTLTFTYRKQTFSIATESIGWQVDAAATADAALAAGRQGGWDGVLTPSRLGFARDDVGLRYRFDRDQLKQKLAELTAGIGSPAAEARIERNGTEFFIVPEQSGRKIDLEQAVRDTNYQVGQFASHVTLRLHPTTPVVRARTLLPALSTAERIVAEPLRVNAAGRTFFVAPDRVASWVTFVTDDPSTDDSRWTDATLLPAIADAWYIPRHELPVIAADPPTLRATINREAVGKYVPDLATAVDRPPVNARLMFADGHLQISGEAQDGNVVDRPAAVTELADAALKSRPAVLKITAKPAEIRPETLPTLGINTLIGSATTTFAGSPPNRTYNIGVGASKFNGALIKPGEEFSFDQVLGDVGPETGYRQELVILENKTTPQYGGGLCQVSTTMFRAAMAAGLPITARTNHAYAVHYYAPIGMDATIYPPYPDLKFINNTPGYILVQTAQAGTSLTFQFFGSSDGRTSHTEMMYSNATEANGGTAAFRYVVEGGPKPINEVFTSTYRPQKDFPLPGQKSLN